MVGVIMRFLAHLSIPCLSLREHTPGAACRRGMLSGVISGRVSTVNSSLSWPSFMTSIYIFPNRCIFTSEKYLLSYSNNPH